MLFPKFPSQPDPAQDYESAIKRLEVLQAQDGADVIGPCITQSLTHGQKTEQVIVFFHGYTACPDQFLTLGTLFFERGYNVLIPRMPYHGLIDRLTPAHAKLKAEALVTLADQTLDMAQGLGERVNVMGLSMGGVLTSWVAQQRGDVERAMIISPALAFQSLPYRWTRLMMWGALIRPNYFVGGDPNAGANSPVPPYLYPHFSSRALGQILRLGFSVRDQAKKVLPAAKQIIMVTNANDLMVDNRAAAELVNRWRERGATIRTCQFPADQQLFHDLIDPSQPSQRTDIVYPVLLDLMMGAG